MLFDFRSILNGCHSIVDLDYDRFDLIISCDWIRLDKDHLMMSVNDLLVNDLLNYYDLMCPTLKPFDVHNVPVVMLRFLV